MLYQRSKLLYAISISYQYLPSAGCKLHNLIMTTKLYR